MFTKITWWTCAEMSVIYWWLQKLHKVVEMRNCLSLEVGDKAAFWWNCHRLCKEMQHHNATSFFVSARETICDADSRTGWRKLSNLPSSTPNSLDISNNKNTTPHNKNTGSLGFRQFWSQGIKLENVPLPPPPSAQVYLLRRPRCTSAGFVIWFEIGNRYAT